MDSSAARDDAQSLSLSDEAVAGEYPEELVFDFVSSRGLSLHLRPIRADDDVRLVEFHGRLSPDSIYRRYFSVHPLLAPGEVTYLTHVDYVNRLALVIEDGGSIVAVGRYDREPMTSSAEVAFVVRDDYQHSGLGRLLLDKLATAAWRRGVTRFTAVTMLENRGMIAVFTHCGFPVTTSSQDEEMSVSFPIDPSLRLSTASLEASAKRE